MVVNVNDFKVKENQGEFELYIDKSVIPVETFTTFPDLCDFLNGYLFKNSYNKLSDEGKSLRNFLEASNRCNTYKKFNELVLI